MSDFDDLDDVFDALRGPATPGELSSENEAIELMANAHLTAKGSSMNSVSRRTRVATLIAAGVIGFGGVAAAGPGGFDIAELDGIEEVTDLAGETTETTVDEETTETTVEESPETTVEEETTETTVEEDDEVTEATEVSVEDEGDDPEARSAVDPAEDSAEDGADEPEDPNPETAFNEAYCLEGNHGKTVSAVARGLAPFDEMDVEVRDAAQSSCGKDADDDDVEEQDDAEENQDVDDDDGEDEKQGDLAVEVDEDRRGGPPAHAGKDKSGDAAERGNSGNGNSAKSNGKGKGKGGK